MAKHKNSSYISRAAKQLSKGPNRSKAGKALVNHKNKYH